MDDLNGTPIVVRTCANCACSIEVTNPQAIGQKQLICRRNAPQLIAQHDKHGKVVGVSLVQAPTDKSLVCFDGWRPAGTLPGDRQA